MREALDQWLFVYGAYALGIGATLAMMAWSWLAMKRAEARREKVRSGSRVGK
ncbi:hypothetical protein K3163_05715 [Qipengyuania sp. 1NDW9]|uniref:Heme exporter protein D n=2 Tax=Qipengyuania TaxID=1855416 RepID=A0A9Q3S0Y0_9SPHN|nr:MULTISPECIES: hypothetical protein [Qipengyuania]MBX7492699.1 hypothetical protein [Qipengyuania xiapuensis]MBY6128333.1 hypothetical protein [Qipengyuania aquimaris]MBY6218149.1 hypothetical protein [Qipengyuania aquimaris]QZD93126.1 hypothetical protein K3162_03560 [Qipengyuania xiapuensis]UOR15240.1 hypothetical protein LCM05_12240 [Qipengyuania aquimaris]